MRLGGPRSQAAFARGLLTLLWGGIPPIHPVGPPDEFGKTAMSLRVRPSE